MGKGVQQLLCIVRAELSVGLYCLPGNIEYTVLGHSFNTYWTDFYAYPGFHSHWRVNFTCTMASTLIWAPWHTAPWQ